MSSIGDKVYTLKIKVEKKEKHLFEGTMSTEDKCTSDSNSICKKMNKSESLGNVFTCADEVNARRRCAEIGRLVCGVCVSHLYKTDIN